MEWIGQHIYDFIARFRSDVYLESISTGTIASGGHLGLDSNNKIVKAVDGGGDITSVIAGVGLSGGATSGDATLTLDLSELSTVTPTSGDFLATLDSDGANEQKTSTDNLATLFAGTGLTASSAVIGVDALQPNITTLAGLTSFGAAGATTDIAAGDLTMYNAVNDGNPTISLGSSATNRLEISAIYNSSAQTLDEIRFNSYASAAGANDGRFTFYVDEALRFKLADTSNVSYVSLLADTASGFIRSSNSTTSSATEGGKLILLADDGAAMADDHRLGVIEFQGAEDASNTRTIGARIEAMCDIAWSASDNAGRLDFYTTKGNATESLVLTLDSNKLATFTGAITATGNITGTLATAAQTNITSLGTLTTLTVDDINLNGKTLTITGDTDDTFTIVTGAAGATTLTTTDAGGTAGHFEVAANGNIVLDAAGDIALECGGGDLTCDADTITFSSANADDPQFIIKNTTADNQGARLQLRKDRGAAMVDGDRIGEIDFFGEDASQNTQQYGKIIVQTIETDHGVETSKMDFKVAQYDGTLSTGLLVSGQDADDEIDVEIGKGAASTTTIAGTLTMGSTAAMTNAGLLSVANQSNVTGVGTISSGVWNGTAIATAYIADDAVTFAKASGVAPKVYGNIIKLIPSDFMANDDGGNTKFGVGYVETAGSGYGMRVPNNATELYAFVSIPEGMKATHVDIFDKNDLAIEVFEAQINATTMTSKGSGNCNTTLDITDVNSSATNFLAIQVTTTSATNDKVYGGQVTIAAI